MTKSFKHRGTFLVVAAIAALPITIGFSSDASAADKCSKGTDVTFLRNTYLIRNDDWICTALLGHQGTAKRPSKSDKLCLVEYWDWCGGAGDEGWAPRDSFRASKKK